MTNEPPRRGPRLLELPAGLPGPAVPDWRDAPGQSAPFAGPSAWAAGAVGLAGVECGSGLVGRIWRPGPHPTPKPAPATTPRRRGPRPERGRLSRQAPGVPEYPGPDRRGRKDGDPAAADAAVREGRPLGGLWVQGRLRDLWGP